jgi:hypothetical protein
MTTPRILASQYKHGCMPHDVVVSLYALREKFVNELSAQEVITQADLNMLDRGGRFSVAVDLFDQCDSETQESLLNDAHPHVKSAAILSRQASELNNSKATIA